MSSIPRKPSTVVRFVAFQKFTNDLPPIGDQKAMDRWYWELRQTLLRLNDQLNDALTLLDGRLDGHDTQITDILAQLALILAQLAEPDEPVDLTDILNQINLINIAIEVLQDGVQFKIEKSQPNGYASLGGDGIVPANELPPPPVFDERLAYALMGG